MTAFLFSWFFQVCIFTSSILYLIKQVRDVFTKIHEDKSKTCILDRLKHKHIGSEPLPFPFATDRERGPRFAWSMRKPLPFPFVAETHRESHRCFVDETHREERIAIEIVITFRQRERIRNARETEKKKETRNPDTSFLTLSNCDTCPRRGVSSRC